VSELSPHQAVKPVCALCIPSSRRGFTHLQSLLLAPWLQGSTLEKTITISIKQISNSSSTGLQELADIVDQWGSSFNYIHASAAITKAGNLQRVQPAAATRLLDTLAIIWGTLLPEADEQGMANVLWACGKLRYSNPQLWSSTLEIF
jgi:hypothetical protein